MCNKNFAVINPSRYFLIFNNNLKAKLNFRINELKKRESETCNGVDKTLSSFIAYDPYEDKWN